MSKELQRAAASDTQCHARPAESTALALEIILTGYQLAFLCIIASQPQIGSLDASSSCLLPGQSSHEVMDCLMGQCLH